MRKFQRVAVVAAVVAGMSTLGAGVSFASDGFDGGVTAIASSQANAVANWGAPQGQSHGEPQTAPWFAPQNGVSYTPEQGHDGKQKDAQPSAPHASK